MALVLNALQERVVSDETDLPPDAKSRIVAKLGELRRRIAWGRVAGVLINSAVSLSPDIPALIEALTPEPPRDPDADAPAAEGPQSMAGFRADFDALMGTELGLTKVVVLVDDLDRCLPAAAVATLEAIKLFLSVEKMAFVLAADEDLVRASIDAHLGGLANGDFAARYTEKIVQLPISLPVLSQQDAEAYVALLIGRSQQMTGAQAQAMTDRARDRRRQGLAPYVVADPEGTPGPDTATLMLAATVAQGLSADMWQTPRAVKRFLNNLAVRQHIAKAAGADLPLALLVRMYVLELRHPAEFKMLAGLPPDARATVLREWEAWARDEDGAQKPADVDDRTRAWATTEPPLTGHSGDIDRYLSLAATLSSDVRFGGAMDAAQRDAVERLLSESDSARRAAVEDTMRMSPAQQDVVVNALGEQMARLPDPEAAVDSLTRLAAADPRLGPVVVTVLQRTPVLRQLQVHHVPYMSGLPQVLRAVVAGQNLDPLTVAAARDALDGP